MTPLPERLPFDREAAIKRFREIPMQFVNGASFESFYVNGALKQWEADQQLIDAFLEGSAEWEDEARIAKARVRELEARVKELEGAIMCAGVLDV